MSAAVNEGLIKLLLNLERSCMKLKQSSAQHVAVQ